jgi:tRNA (adenine58-N1)-methyltransferase non-catalytic subunit
VNTALDCTHQPSFKICTLVSLYITHRYIARKQMKYQLRCRLVRCTGATLCDAMYLKDAKRIMNLRSDTLAQILSYANITAGCQTLVWDDCLGLVIGAIAQRMGGYGKLLSLYAGQQPALTELIARFNLSFPENYAIKWLHVGDVLRKEDATIDEEKDEREVLEWPCSLQDHTREFVAQMKTEQERKDFLAKRAARFARKLTRHTPYEALEWLRSRPCDSIVLAVKLDPTETLLELMPYLASSCPFVVYCEFIEPLTECFRELQSRNMAINMRLSDTWTREYQVLPGRTHPNMSMSQSGGFILSGIKLDEKYGHSELDDEQLKQMKEKRSINRRGRKKKKAEDDVDDGANDEDEPDDNEDFANGTGDNTDTKIKGRNDDNDGADDRAAKKQRTGA